MSLPSFSILALSIVLVLAAADTHDRVNANIDYGTFQEPSSRVRPRFRYWLPDSSVDADVVGADIRSAGSIGAGGVEFLPFFNYGGEIGPTPPGANWSTSNFGTPAFQEVFRAALQAHKDAGLVMDFALGPNQGQGVPANVTDDGLQWDLVPHSSAVSSTGAFSGTIPGWGEGELIALVSARILNQTNVSLPGASLNPSAPSESSYLRFVLSHDSLTDWKGNVSSSGQVSLSFPSADYRLFAYYQKKTLNKNLVFASNRSENIFDNGSYVVDHYSARGAQTITNFWETYVLTNGVKELLLEVGNYGWEDSIEILSNTSWTPGLPARFQQKLGYSILPYLPVVQFADNNLGILGSDPGPYQVVLDTLDGGQGYINDFRGVLEDGFREYLQWFTNWTNSYLNLQYSQQVSYNLPMDMQANIAEVNAPECESLGFGDNIDAYRQFTGVANLAGKRVISNEMGAVYLKSYQLQVSHLLWQIGRAFSAGVNQVVLHGQSYTGDYYGTTWPGYTAFSYIFSESYSNKQPAWDHGFGDALNYVARLQYVLQRGVPKMDVVLYHKPSATDTTFSTAYKFPDLVEAGYTYQYLSPLNFAYPQATVKDGVLAPDGPAYKALIVQSTENLTLSGVQHMQTYAKTGLQIIFSGGRPGFYATANDSSQAATEAALAELLQQENVYSVDAGQVASKLASLNIDPNVKIQTNGTWYAAWRENDAEGIDYAFIFCDTNSSTGTVTISSTKTPYVFNAWTGEQTPLIPYTRENSSVSIPLDLAGNQTIIIAFTSTRLSGCDAPPFSVTELPSVALGSTYNSSHGLAVHVAHSTSPQSVSLSTGFTTTLNISSVAAPFTLTNWTLVAEHWEAPSNISDARTIALKRNTTHQLSNLVSWTQIPALVNTSGLGYYSTSFTWAPFSSSSSGKLPAADGAYITFPPVLHALRVRINGHALPPLDFAAPKADITRYLQDGTNSVEAVVPTTMWNYLRSIWSEILDAGTPPLLSYVTSEISGPEEGQGLIGDVVITPYRTVRVGKDGVGATGTH